MEGPTGKQSTKAQNRDRWYFTPEALNDSPSIRAGMSPADELSFRQQAANFIQDMGQKLRVSQLCINTAIVYMHRFYVFHSFKKFHRNHIAVCALFLAAKVEEQPRKMEAVITVAQHCLSGKPITVGSQLPPLPKQVIAEESARLIKNENIMLQTLGFDIAIEHPHTFVVKTCELVKATKDLAQTCYFMATNSLHLTTLCLQQRPTVVACVCIYLACQWSDYDVPRSREGREWFNYVDPHLTLDTLKQLTNYFISILDQCPSRLKMKIMQGGGKGSGSDNVSNASPSHVTHSSQSSHSSTPPPTRHFKMEEPVGPSRHPPPNNRSVSTNSLSAGSSWSSIAAQNQQKRYEGDSKPLSSSSIISESPQTPPLPSQGHVASSWNHSSPSVPSASSSTSSRHQHPNSRNSSHSNNSQTIPVKVEVPSQPSVGQSREKHSLADYKAKKEQERRLQEARDNERQLKLLEEERRRDQEARKSQELERQRIEEEKRVKLIEEERLRKEKEAEMKKQEEERRKQLLIQQQLEEAERIRLQLQQELLQQERDRKEQEERERQEQEESNRIAQEALRKRIKEEEEESARLLQEEIQRNLKPVVSPVVLPVKVETPYPSNDVVVNNNLDDKSSVRSSHHKEKKKKKHKNKDKDRDKSHKSHKKDKHKDKDRDSKRDRPSSSSHSQSHGSSSHTSSHPAVNNESIKLKIPFSKISSHSAATEGHPPTKLKIVINKDRLSSTSPSSPSRSSGSDYHHQSSSSRKRRNSTDYGHSPNKKPVV